MVVETTSMDETIGTAISESVFRPLKRRKFYRKRAGKNDNNEDNDNDGEQSKDNIPLITSEAIPTAPLREAPHESDNETDESTSLRVAKILHLRKLTRHRKLGGIEFTVARPPPESGSRTPQQPGEDHDEEEFTPEEVKKVVNRFAPQTGQVMDVNKHMMAYIDSELARRREGNSAPPQAWYDDGPGSSPDSPGGGGRMVSGTHLQRQPAALGKLHEIDLGPDAARTNIERTTKMLEGGEPATDDQPGRKVRLGRDGKPWRGRKRRTSEDIQRDRLVEEVLRESRLEIYDEAEPEANPDDEQAADDRIAEQFRREFMDAISSRRRRAPAAKKPGAKEERPKGPKLGGSRAARAAMREQQEKAGARK